MGKELALAEPIALPDLSKGRTLSLPAWAERSRGALVATVQKIGTEFRENVTTLPPALMPNAPQRAAIEAHLRSLNSSLSETPEAGEIWAARVAETVSKLLKALGGAKSDDLGAEAKGEAYSDVLDDVPWWAVRAAQRDWYRGECGLDKKGKPFDYHWPPDPAVLRDLALRHVWRVKGHMRELQTVLEARPYVDCGAEYAACCERGRAALETVFRAVAARDAESLKGMTIEEAAALARAPRIGKGNADEHGGSAARAADANKDVGAEAGAKVGAGAGAAAAD